MSAMVATTPSGADSGPFWVAPQQGTKAAVADQPAEPTALQPLQNGKTSPQKTGPGTTHRNGSRRWSMELDVHLESRKKLVTDASSASVRQLLTQEENAEVDDEMLNQFLRATKHDVDKAAKRLKDTVKWRLAEQPHTKVCTKCMAKPRAHYMHVVGFSKKDQPIIYSCMAMAKDRDVLANREHMLVTFEQAIRAMPPHVSQWIWLCDFHGFGIRDCDPRLARMFLDISERHYPERLSEFINISTPSVFSMLWKAIEPWVDPVTRKKVKFIGFDARQDSSKNRQIRQELDRLVDPDLRDWLLEEMAQNRTRVAVKNKVYPYGKVHAPEGGAQSVILDGHDSRGSSPWIKAVEASPQILLPDFKPA